MFLLIDNYDSFTYNLVHFLGELGVTCDVRRNDTLTPKAALALEPEAIVISPGPSDPDHAGICLALVAAAAAARMPVLGVCLGHQSIGDVYGEQKFHRAISLAPLKPDFAPQRPGLNAARLWPSRSPGPLHLSPRRKRAL